MGTALAVSSETSELPPSPVGKIILVASIAAGVQFGWALQLSLLTPYVQLLGVPHMWAAFIWLCGPVSGMLVQPTVGYFSDRCTSRFGRRRPFIVAGATLVTVAVFLIGFAADLGHLFGDPVATTTIKPKAVACFVIGFWILDVANNTLQGPCRALLADLAGGDHHQTRAANAAFSFFMAVGNVLGYAAGSYKKLYRILPFTMTKACETYCANLKTCFLISVVFLILVTFLATMTVKEKPIEKPGVGNDDKQKENSSFFGEVSTSFKTLSKPMWILMAVTCLNWIGWFPFLLFDTDWMGKEVYGGVVNSASGSPQASLYDLGVRMGSLGLMANSVVLALASVAVEPLVRMLGVKRVWGAVNLVLAIGLALTVWITKAAEHARLNGHQDMPPPMGVKVGSIILFAVLGIPLAITYSIPFALASIFSISSGTGQGLSLGVLNLAIVIPQMFVSVVSGPVDAFFGGGNLPAFLMGSIAAAASAVFALTVLPLPSQDIRSLAPGGMH